MADSELPSLVALGGGSEPDMEIRRGNGVDDERAVLTWAEYQERRGSGLNMARYALPMRERGRDGQPGTGSPVLMPAEKYLKWYSQGYRPVASTEDFTVVEFPPAPRPTRWFPSMVEEAIQNGEPIPSELRPPGYFGPTFDHPDEVVEEPTSPAEASERVCGLDGCDYVVPKSRKDPEGALRLHRLNASIHNQ